MTRTGLVDAARRALDAAQENPSAALAAARAVIAEAGDDIESLAVALWAAGLAERELNRLGEADRSLVDAIGQAERIGRLDLAAGARSSRSLVLTLTGRLDEGLSELARAEPHVVGGELGRVRMQRALILQRQGHLDRAIDAFTAALPELVAAQDNVVLLVLKLIYNV